MNCPKDQTELVAKEVGGVELDVCNTCGGAWLEEHELDQVEDEAFDKDELKGSLVWRAKETTVPCPVCSTAMHEFYYRLWEDLMLEMCPQKHGWWLDAGELVRVGESMEDREDDILRKYAEEDDWKLTLQAMQSPDMLDDLVVWLDDAVERMAKRISS